LIDAVFDRKRQAHFPLGVARSVVQQILDHCFHEVQIADHIVCFTAQPRMNLNAWADIVSHGFSDRR